MKKRVLNFFSLAAVLSVFVIFINCSTDKDLIENDGVHFSPLNKKFTFQDFKNETGIQQFSPFQRVKLKTQKLALRNLNLNADFITDTTKVSKYTNPSDQKTTYTFKIYPYNNQLSEKEYFNLVYEKVGEEWNQLIFYIKDKENPLPNENPIETSEMVYNSLSRGFFAPITNYSFHCTGTGPCASGICDMCNLCVTQTVSYIYITIMPDSGGSSGGGEFGGSGGGGATGTTGVFVPVSYNTSDINLDNPIWTIYQNFNSFVNALPNNLKELFNLQANSNVHNHVYPTILNYFLENGLNTNQTFVQQCLVNYLQIKNTFNPTGWHINEIDSFNLWALRSLLNGQNANEISILAVKLKNINNKIGSQRIIQSLLNEEIDFESANELSTLALNETNQQEVDELVNMSLIFEKYKNNFENENFLLEMDQYVDLDIANYMVSNPNDPIFIHFTIQCAAARFNFSQQPGWNNLSPFEQNVKVYWKASKDLVHIALDVLGLFPAVGEVADLTNGVLYVIEGDGVNATLSFASAIPFVGWASVSSKYAIKITSVGTTKVALKWKKVGNLIEFGDRNNLRKMMGLTSNGVHAHHIIPVAFSNSDLVQKAAKSNQAFHMNEAFNGFPLLSTNHLTGHDLYNNKIQSILTNNNALIQNMNLDQSFNFLKGLNLHIKGLLQANPNMNLGQISNLINYP